MKRAFKEVLLLLLLFTLVLLLLVNRKLLRKGLAPITQAINQRTNLLGNWTLTGGCEPQHSIVFIKTHKAGSSSVTNILHRYGDENGLHFVLPAHRENRLGWPNTFNASFYKRLLQGKSANILSLHSRYNRSTMEQVMQKGAFYLTILREPVSQYESTFSFMEFGKILQLKGSNHLEIFMRNPYKVMKDKVMSLEFSNYYFQRLQLIRNGMLFDLGFPQYGFDDKKAIIRYVKKLDTEFDLVMIMEHFDESLVLLKRLLCWSLDDVVYFALNRRAHKSRQRVSSDLRKKIQQWNYGDYVLYNHFNKSLWERIAMEGPEFFDEVEQFRKKLLDLNKSCLEQPPKPTRRRRRQVTSTALEQLRVRQGLNSDVSMRCELMLRNETSYIEYLKVKQGVPHNETEISKDRTKGLEYLHEFVDNIYDGEATVVT